MAKDTQFVGQIADIEKDFPQWYTDVVLKTKMVDYGPVKGTMVIRPYAYAIWENIQREMDKRFKAQGVENAYFPLLIPLPWIQFPDNGQQIFAVVSLIASLVHG